MSQHHDLYASVTERIIEDLKQGVRPWAPSWKKGAPARGLPLRHTGVPYRGANVLILWLKGQLRGYSSPTWMTFRQAQVLGGRVRAGEKATHVVYAKSVTREGTDETGNSIEREILLTMTYAVFNTDQIDGLDDMEPPPEAPDEPIEGSEVFFASTGAQFRHGGNQAYYSPISDVIQLPPVANFESAEAYCSVKAHELTHWTMHPTRLNRELKDYRMESEDYAREELVAELGAAFLCASLGVNAEPRSDHADYIAHWLKILSEDPKAIFKAAAQAQRAVDYLYGLQPV